MCVNTCNVIVLCNVNPVNKCINYLIYKLFLEPVKTLLVSLPIIYSYCNIIGNKTINTNVILLYTLVCVHNNVCYKLSIK